MIFTASDVSSVSQSLQRWDWAEYISEAFVILACAGELVADLGENWLGEKRKKHLERRSTILLVAALSVSLICLVRTNELSGNVIGSLGDKADEADTKAKKSIEDSSTALSQAKDALTKSGEAEDSSGRAEDKAEKAKIATSGAMIVAQTAHTEANSVPQEIGKAAEQLRQVEGEAQKTKSDLMNLALCSAPRVISNWFLIGGNVFADNKGSDPRQVAEAAPGNSKSYVDSLLPMAGQMVFIEVIPNDPEARRAALEIARTLADAQWNVQKPLRLVDGLKDGVSVQPSLSRFTAPNGGIPNMYPYWHASDVAEKLLDFLHSYNWQAASGLPTDPQGQLIRDEKVLPVGAIRIQIGLYPAAVYVTPPGQKEFASRMEEQKREREKGEAESKRRREEQLAKVLAMAPTPEIRKRLQAQNEEWEARIKNETSTGPCQVLNPDF
jgi:hypothetical protein